MEIWEADIIRNVLLVASNACRIWGDFGSYYFTSSYFELVPIQ